MSRRVLSRNTIFGDIIVKLGKYGRQREGGRQGTHAAPLRARADPPGAQRGLLLIRLYSSSGSRQIRKKPKSFLEHFGPGRAA
jgi:hypothetical protein